MNLSSQLYESVTDIWETYHTHPFVEKIGTGTLDIDKFRFYMIQDYLYLLDYAKVFALGIVKSHDEKTMKSFSGMVYSILNEEMNIHKSYMKRLGITETEIQEAKPALINKAYASYMLRVAHEEGVLEILVAVLSCAWSYQEIGERHKKIDGAKEHPLFGEWISGYTSDSYIKGTTDIIELIDLLGKDSSEKDIEHLKDIFVQCSRHEYMFWEMAYQKEL